MSAPSSSSDDNAPPPPYSSPSTPARQPNINTGTNPDTNTNTNNAIPVPTATPSSTAQPAATADPSLYNLFITAIGGTPEMPAADTFSPQDQEEEVWTVDNNDLEAARDGQQTAVARAATGTTHAAVGATMGTAAESGSTGAIATAPAASAAAVAAIERRESGQEAVNDESGMMGVTNPRTAAPVVHTSSGDVARYPGSVIGGGGGGEPPGQTESSTRVTRRTRRRRLFGGGGRGRGDAGGGGGGSNVSAEHSSSNSSRASPASRIVRFNNNPLFRAVSDRSMFRSGWGGGGAAGAATVQSVAQAQGVAGEWGGVNGQAAGSAGGGETVDDSDSARAEGRILFYHKPTLANVPAGDVPDVVPVYLGCPGGGMALGLPLNEAWQGGDQQDTTFNQNLSYTILSWPEQHAKDLIELRRQQVLFMTAMAFNLVVTGLLLFADNPNRTRVEGPARVGSFPGPFEQRISSDESAISRAEEDHLLAVLLIGLWGILSVLSLSRVGIALYLCFATVNVIVGIGAAPDALFACRYLVDVVLVVIGRSLLSALTYQWVTASAGDGGRG